MDQLQPKAYAYLRLTSEITDSLSDSGKCDKAKSDQYRAVCGELLSVCQQHSVASTLLDALYAVDAMVSSVLSLVGISEPKTIRDVAVKRFEGLAAHTRKLSVLSGVLYGPVRTKGKDKSQSGDNGKKNTVHTLVHNRPPNGTPTGNSANRHKWRREYRTIVNYWVSRIHKTREKGSRIRIINDFLTEKAEVALWIGRSAKTINQAFKQYEKEWSDAINKAIAKAQNGTH